jgi:transcriptional regulator with XRE-family HTH domain
MAASPSATRVHFAARLKELRNRRGFKTARMLAQNLGIDENRYTRYERAEVEPDLSLVVRICKALATTPNELLGVHPNGFEEPANPELAPPTEGQRIALDHANTRYRALARRLAREIADARGGSGKADDALGRLTEISRIVAEIERDPFDYVKRLPSFSEVKALDKQRQQQIAQLAEQLMDALEEQFVVTK